MISGKMKDYEIEISKVDYANNEKNKGMEIEIVDKELLELTNGIVQGMSGSPIIQNGKIIGAVTHVFVNDSKRGYGIFIENMLVDGN
jgi:stage IV sporulation protein B